MKPFFRLIGSTLAALVGLNSFSAAQAIYVVDGAGGTGATHTTISDAIQAAADGDFILVRGGTYNEEVRVDGKGLTVQAEFGAVVRVTNLVVENLAANQTAALRRLAWHRNSGGVRLELTNNAGPVWIEQSYIPQGGTTWWGGGGSMRVTRSS